MIRAICSFTFTSREQNLAVSQSRATHNTTMSVQQQCNKQAGSLHCTENACGLCPLQVTPTMELAHVRDLRFV